MSLLGGVQGVGAAGIGIAQIVQGVQARSQSDEFAESIRSAGEDRSSERVRLGRLREGNIRSAAAASGVVVGVGSNYEAIAANAFRTSMDAQRIRFQFGVRAAMAEQRGEAAFAAALSEATRTIIGGAESVLDTLPFSPETGVEEVPLGEFEDPTSPRTGGAGIREARRISA